MTDTQDFNDKAAQMAQQLNTAIENKDHGRVNLVITALVNEAHHDLVHMVLDSESWYSQARTETREDVRDLYIRRGDVAQMDADEVYDEYRDVIIDGLDQMRGRGIYLYPETAKAIVECDADGYMSEQLKVDVPSYYGGYEEAQTGHDIDVTKALTGEHVYDPMTAVPEIAHTPVHERTEEPTVTEKSRVVTETEHTTTLSDEKDSLQPVSEVINPGGEKIEFSAEDAKRMFPSFLEELKKEEQERGRSPYVEPEF